MDAAMAELIDKGFDGVTMLSVAKKVGASKETLYSWFGNKDGLFAAMIERNSEQAAGGVRRALANEGDPRDVLIGFATGLQSLLSSPESIALNRASMVNPTLADLLLAGGRHRVGPLVEEYLGRLRDAGEIVLGNTSGPVDVADAFTLLYGLVMRDTQISVLLGESAPTRNEITKHASMAIDQFLTLTR